MKKIIALTDYKNKFGSKHFDSPYRSGMDKDLIRLEFEKLNFSIDFIPFSKCINAVDLSKDCYYIYTSSEDEGYRYKNFIEDQILYLENNGFNVIPSYKYLRANNNKVFMELLRKSTHDKDLLSIKSQVFGTYEEAVENMETFSFPVIIKKSEGASGRGVYMAENFEQLKNTLKKVAKTANLFHDLKEIGRTYKHKGYKKESKYRSKFIVQNMIPNLKNDWKVYYFMDKLYIFYRPILKHRKFKASGGGYDNYSYATEAHIPDGIFNFVEKVIGYFNVPHASLDIAYDGSSFHLIEIQFIYFGTAGIPYSDGYFSKVNNDWQFIKNKLSIEEVYVQSIVRFIEKSNF